MLNKKLLRAFSVMQTLFLLALVFGLFYLIIYKQYILPSVTIFAVLIVIIIFSSPTMLKRMLHTKIGNALSIFIILFFIFGYYKGYIMAPKPPVDYAFIEIILMFIIFIYSLSDFIKGKKRYSKAKINN